jgi:hypothetical protein
MRRATPSAAAKNIKKSTSSIATLVVAEQEEIPSPAASSATKTPRKRESKKKFPIVAIVTPDGIEGNFTIQPRRPLIAHLPIHSTEVVFHDAPIQYNPHPPSEPDPFNDQLEVFETTSATITQQETVYDKAPEHVQDESTSTPAAAGSNSAPVAGGSAASGDSSAPTPAPATFAKVELLVSFKGGVQTQTLPESSAIACFWCCHAFEGRPCIIPIREERGIYEVYGNFCCPECALAYVLDERDDSHLKWEKIALLHRIYGAAVAPGGGRIYPAPAKATLAHFGGSLSIDAYRRVIRERKIRLDIHLPPMVSILATMDTKPIDFYETTIPKSFVPLNSERLQKADEGLRLKRTKPLKDKESTLDAVMNLQIRRVPIANPYLTGSSSGSGPITA